MDVLLLLVRLVDLVFAFNTNTCTFIHVTIMRFKWFYMERVVIIIQMCDNCTFNFFLSRPFSLSVKIV